MSLPWSPPCGGWCVLQPQATTRAGASIFKGETRMRTRSAQAAARRRQIETELQDYRRRGGQIAIVPGFERVGTRGDRDNSHLFGYRKR